MSLGFHRRNSFQFPVISENLAKNRAVSAGNH